MVKKNPSPFAQPNLSADFEKAFLSATRQQMKYEPHDVLKALLNLLIKPKRIASVLHVKPEMVRFMASGRQKTAEKYLPALTHLLRLAIQAAKGEVDKAEKREIMWGKFAFPEETLQFFRQRIQEAELVLEKEEKGK